MRIDFQITNYCGVGEEKLNIFWTETFNRNIWVSYIFVCYLLCHYFNSSSIIINQSLNWRGLFVFSRGICKIDLFNLLTLYICGCASSFDVLLNLRAGENKNICLLFPAFRLVHFLMSPRKVELVSNVFDSTFPTVNLE